MFHAIFVIVVFAAVSTSAQTECNLQLQDNVKTIYFDRLKWKAPEENPSYPTKSVKNGQNLALHCPTGFLNNEFISEQLTFQCNNGKFNRSFLYEDLLCRSDFHQKVVVESTGHSELGSRLLKCDQKDWQVYQVKLEKTDGSRDLVYTVCFDTKIMRPKFSLEPKKTAKPVLTHHSRANDVWGFDRFGRDTRERIALSRGYLQRNQKRRISEYFYDKRPYNYYFQRGHLAPYADFSDHEQQKATCEYLNAAPQWSGLNEGSWSLVEREARSILQSNTEEWEIYTGTYGAIATTKGDLTVAPIFAPNGRFEKSLLPVPMLYWKIVYNNKDRTKSRAFVGVNNPEYKLPQDIPAKYRLCQPIAGKGKPFQGDEYKGFTYECAIDEFLNKLKTDEKIVA